jgi:N-acylglucosamine 2-epimerase
MEGKFRSHSEKESDMSRQHLVRDAGPVVPQTTFSSSDCSRLPGTISGISLEELRADYHDRLFNRYLPFWENGGYDSKNGGFMCELYDDGTIQDDEKFIWYQGRSIWIYAHLYNQFGHDGRHLEIADKTREFLVEHMYVGNGIWSESVDRNGKIIASSGQGSGQDIFGAMFSAVGLVELFRAKGREEDLDIARETILTAMKRYEDPGYDSVHVPGVDKTGLRSQGHSFMAVWSLTQLLSFIDDPELEAYQQEHVNHIVHDFWHADYGIVNEYLYHDYTCLPGHESFMEVTGHSIEALWMVMHEAIRTGDRALFDTCKTRSRRLIEMSWDYVYEGCGTNQFHVFGDSEHCQGPSFEIKNMWTHTEILIVCMTVLEYTGEVWAKEWYERTREYTLRTMANTGHGVWRQAVDRYGDDRQRSGISPYRKGNFHQPRYMMMNLMSLDRMIKNNRHLTPFPD